MRKLLFFVLLVFAGCFEAEVKNQSVSPSVPKKETLAQARRGFVTSIVKEGDAAGPPDRPNGDLFELIDYESPVGPLAAYVTVDPKDGRKHPAIVWITGGDNNSIGDVWSPRGRDNDQSASAFRKAGLVMMFPSQRGGNDNPGKREGFFGEVDDVLAATDHLASLPYVDPNRIYLGGHSTGGTLAMLIGASTDRYEAVFSLGPVAGVDQYGGNYVYCAQTKREIELRSPLNWLHCISKPMFVIEGEDGNWDGAVEIMKSANLNPSVQFFKVKGFDHFNVIAPVAEELADRAMRGKLDDMTQKTFDQLK